MGKIRYSGMFIILWLVWMLLGATTVYAELTTGDEVLQQVDQIFSAAETRELDLKMTIVNEKGQEREQELRLLSKGAELAIVKFLAPMEVEGTGFLLRKEKGEMQMWFYLPAIGKARKISSQMQQGNFMGTDFSYSDLSMLDGSKYQDRYQSELLGIDVFQEYRCYLLALTPTHSDLAYAEIKMWVRMADFIPTKVEFFDQEGNLAKRMINSQIKEVSGYLTPHLIEMEDLHGGTRTILEIQQVRYNIDLPDQIFTPRYLERG